MIRVVLLAAWLSHVPALPDVQPPNANVSTAAVASVEGREISLDRFRQAYRQTLESYRRMYGDAIDDKTLKQLKLEQQVLQQLIDEEAEIFEAQHLGIEITQEEIRNGIRSMPAFQTDGRFVEGQYLRILKSQKPPLTSEAFEEQVRRSLIREKLRDKLTPDVVVSDEEVEVEVKRRLQEKTKPTPAALNSIRAGVKEGLQREREDQSFADAMTRARQSMKILVNPDLIAKVVSGRD